MTGITVLVLGVLFTLALLIAVTRVAHKLAKSFLTGLAVVILLLSLALSSTAYVGADEVGIVSRHLFGSNLKDGKIIAVDGENGVQADVLTPGWHFGIWPVIYSVRNSPLTAVESGKVGLIEAIDGVPLESGQLFAPEWKTAEFQKMLDARYFLTTGKGCKGKQVSVLTPGKYRLNTELFRVQMVDQTEILQGEVGVLKANFGTPPSELVRGAAGALEPGKHGDEVSESELLRLAKDGEMGVREAPLPPGKYPINTDAYTVVELWTTQMIAHYTADHAEAGQRHNDQGGKAQSMPEESEITVRTSDGFTFPVDVRLEYVIQPHNAPIVVAKLGDDEGDRFRNAMNSAVRAIFRNNAEKVRALDYVQERSQQESQSLQALAQQMARFGITVTAVRIGNVGNENSLGALLKTQTDRELAKQEQLTFQEQQKAAEQKKQLARTTQESEEEKKLATAAYSVKIAMETQKQKVAEAEGESQAISIRAKAQAEAYKEIAAQIGMSNAALIEALKIVGEKGIQITPRIMMGGNTRDQANTALVGTMLDTMLSREEDRAPGTPTPAGTPK